MRTAFPTWTFNPAGLPALPGNLSVQRYDAFKNAASADFTVRYDSGATAVNTPGGILDQLKTGAAVLQWVQVVHTSAPLGGTTSPYIDPRPNDDSLPFYWTETERTAAAAGNYSTTNNPNGTFEMTFTFKDGPNRRLVRAPLTWEGRLYLVAWDKQAPGVVTVFDELVWGFRIHCQGSTATPGTDTKGGAGGDKFENDTGTGGQPTCSVPGVPAASPWLLAVLAGVLVAHPIRRWRRAAI